jgi:hypothetical protein
MTVIRDAYGSHQQTCYRVLPQVGWDCDDSAGNARTALDAPQAALKLLAIFETFHRSVHGARAAISVLTPPANYR